MSSNYLSRDIVKNGSIIPLSEALAAEGLTDEKGNTITFDTADFPNLYVESNGFAYSLEGLDKALVKLRIEKIPT